MTALLRSLLFRLAGQSFALKILFGLGDILLGDLNAFSALPVKQVGAFIGGDGGSIRNMIRRIFLRGFPGIGTVAFRFLLGLHIGVFHALGGYSGLVNGFNRFFRHSPGFNVRHRRPPPRRAAQSAWPQRPFCRWYGCIRRWRGSAACPRILHLHQYHRGPNPCTG